MFNSYLKTALRSLLHDRFYSLINVLGLSIGVATCMILGLYLLSELTYDRHFDEYQQIYRVANEVVSPNEVNKAAMTSAELGPILAREYPEVQEFVRFEPASENRFLLRSLNGQAYYWENAYFADDNVFDIFSHDVVYGDPEFALVAPSSVAISESAARQYFGDENPVGEVLESELAQYEVALVFADLPDNTHLKYDILLSYNQKMSAANDQALLSRTLWRLPAYTYVTMPPNYDLNDFDAVSADFYERYMASTASLMGFTSEIRYYLESLASIHFASEALFDQPRGNWISVMTFAVTGVFVLLVACINYINLATARSIRRAREIGVRKAIGADRRQLVIQFIVESVLMALVSIIVAVALATLVLETTPLVNLLNKNLSVVQLFNIPALLSLVLLGLLIGSISGLYPAMYLSSVSPCSVLPGSDSGPLKRGGNGVRQSLMLLQFVISIGAVAFTLLIFVQMQFVYERPLGFAKEDRLVVRIKGADQVERLPAFMNELVNSNSIVEAARAENMPGFGVGGLGARAENEDGTMSTQTFSVMGVDFNFIDVAEIEIVEGRGFSEEMATDADQAVLVNEALVESMGWDSPLGKIVENVNGTFSAEVIGVVRNFNFQGLQEEITPLVIRVRGFTLSYLASDEERQSYAELLVLHVSPGGFEQAVETLQSRWPDFDPSTPLEFTTLESALDGLYDSQDRQMRLIGVLALICIVVTCFGLFGLTAFATEQRTREIGIRKVLGASVSQVISMMFKNTLLLILLASLAAAAVTVWLINMWLQQFYYQADINYWIFPASSIAVLLVSFLAVTLQSVKAAQTNPSVTLRHS